MVSDDLHTHCEGQTLLVTLPGSDSISDRDSQAAGGADRSGHGVSDSAGPGDVSSHWHSATVSLPAGFRGTLCCYFDGVGSLASYYSHDHSRSLAAGVGLGV